MLHNVLHYCNENFDVWRIHGQAGSAQRGEESTEAGVYYRGAENMESGKKFKSNSARFMCKAGPQTVSNVAIAQSSPPARRDARSVSEER